MLICLLYYVPHRTGYSIYVQRIAEALAGRGHEVTVLCARHQRGLSADEVRGGVRVRRLWAPIALSRGMIMPGYPLELERLVKAHDVVLVNTPMAETALVAWTARRHGRPLVATHHGDLILPQGLANRAIGAAMLGLFRYMAERVYALVGPSEDYARQSEYLQPYAGKVRLIRPPVLIPRPDPLRARELRQRWAPGGGPVIGYAGRFVEEKRPDLLIHALDIVAATHPGVRAVFAGQYDIPYEGTWQRHRKLVERNRARLVLLGSLADPQDMADYYAALDVLVLPSDTDSFALVQAEAMLCGTPVVATDTPGARMPILETGMGRIAARGDARAIAQAVLDVLEHRDKYSSAVDAAERAFSLEDTVARYEALLLEAVRSTRVPVMA